MHPSIGHSPLEGPLCNAWFELNYRLQEEAGDFQLNIDLVEQWLMRVLNIVSPGPQCFWLFLARINELALLCASRYVDCGEFSAADAFLAEPSRVFLHVHRERKTDSRNTGRESEWIPVEMEAGPLLPCLYRLLEGSGYMTGDYLLSVSYRTYKIRQVTRMLMELGAGNMEQIAEKLSGMDMDRRKDVLSKLCLFDRRTFNELGRALHLYMLSGRVDHQYVGKYLRE